jgi:hypothetical protein
VVVATKGDGIGHGGDCDVQGITAGAQKLEALPVESLQPNITFFFAPYVVDVEEVGKAEVRVGIESSGK